MRSETTYKKGDLFVILGEPSYYVKQLHGAIIQLTLDHKPGSRFVEGKVITNTAPFAGVDMNWSLTYEHEPVLAPIKSNKQATFLLKQD